MAEKLKREEAVEPFRQREKEGPARVKGGGGGKGEWSVPRKEKTMQGKEGALSLVLAVV